MSGLSKGELDKIHREIQEELDRLAKKETASAKKKEEKD